LTIDYNQRHRVELEAARRIAAALAERHILLPLDLRAFGGSALTIESSPPERRTTAFFTARHLGGRRRQKKGRRSENGRPSYRTNLSDWEESVPKSGTRLS
jgi:hypothetical protein